MFLHAYRLSFMHPVGGETVTVHAALPADCQRFLDALPVAHTP
jgi:23S rRNA pseudouridine955/2504/2580 synthase